MGPYLARAAGVRRGRARDASSSTGSPRCRADWESKLRDATLHPGEHDDWDYAYGEFTHDVDNAQKVLLMDPREAQRGRSRTAIIDYFLSSCGSLYPEAACADLKLPEVPRQKLARLKAKLPPYSHAPVLVENDAPPQNPHPCEGDYREPARKSQPGTLAVLPPLPAGSSRRGSTLARWLTSPRQSADRAGRGQPHLAGVLRPRHRPHLGRFRHAGRRPTHPELLDWLASEFMERGWSMKQMHPD